MKTIRSSCVRPNRMHLLRIGALAYALLLVGLSFAHAQTKQAQTKQNRDVPPFESIQLTTAAKVYLSQGTPQQVIVEAPAQAITSYTTTVKDNTLRIGSKFNNSRRQSVTVRITVTRVARVEVTGCGYILGQNTLTGDHIAAHVTGSGKISLQAQTNKAKAALTGSGDLFLDIDATALQAALTGPGDMKLAGKVEALTIQISGSGDIKANQCHNQRARINISGSGDARVHVEQRITAKISGSGDVRYTGGAEKIDQKIVGSGGVTPL